MARTVPIAFHHTCYVVRDLEGTAQRLADAFGAGPWNVWTIAPARGVLRGRETSFSFRVALATVGGGTLELIAPLGGRSVLHEHLEQHGEGYHHAGFLYPTIEAFRQARADLVRQGRQVIQEGGTDEVFEFAYFDFPELNTALEVLYLDPSKLPPPEKVVQPAP